MASCDAGSGPEPDAKGRNRATLRCHEAPAKLVLHGMPRATFRGRRVDYSFIEAMTNRSGDIEQAKLWMELRKLERALQTENDTGIRKVIEHRIAEIKKRLVTKSG